jgi:hypothetical protein
MHDPVVAVAVEVGKIGHLMSVPVISGLSSSSDLPLADR